MNAPAAPDNALVLQWIFGTLVVAMYAWDRFKHPPLTRATTTFLRYWSAACGYFIAMLGLFVFLGGGIISLDLRAIEPLVGAFPKEVATLPGPLLSALLLTSLLPHFPLLARIDENIKQWFWRVGNIPIEVRVLSAGLARASYQVPGALEDPAASGLAAAFAARGASAEWLGEPAGSLKQRWACCVALSGQIEQWADMRGYADYVDENKAALVDIRQRLATLARLLNERTLTELGQPGDSLLVAHLRKNIDSDMAALWRALCDFVAGGVLTETWNDRQRRKALAQLGFTGLPQERNPMSSHDIVLVVGIVFLAILFIPLMMRRFFDPDILPLQARLLVMVPIVYAIAIVVAIYPKAVWPFAARTDPGARPVAAYALSGLAAALAAFVVSVLFRFAFDSHGNVVQALATPGAFANAWHTSMERWPWQLMTFMATVSIAWAADDYQPATAAPPKWLRWAESAALAVAFGLSQWAVVHLLMMNAPAERVERLEEALLRMVLMAGVVGASIGFLVPSMVRAKGTGAVAAERTVAAPVVA
jgi:hypothetical protein